MDDAVFVARQRLPGNGRAAAQRTKYYKRVSLAQQTTAVFIITCLSVLVNKKDAAEKNGVLTSNIPI
jgi:hypothetical protein